MCVNVVRALRNNSVSMRGLKRFSRVPHARQLTSKALYTYRCVTCPDFAATRQDYGHMVLPKKRIKSKIGCRTLRAAIRFVARKQPQWLICGRFGSANHGFLSPRNCQCPVPRVPYHVSCVHVPRHTLSVPVSLCPVPPCPVSRVSCPVSCVPVSVACSSCSCVPASRIPVTRLLFALCFRALCRVLCPMSLCSVCPVSWFTCSCVPVPSVSESPCRRVPVPVFLCHRVPASSCAHAPVFQFCRHPCSTVSVSLCPHGSMSLCRRAPCAVSQCFRTSCSPVPIACNQIKVARDLLTWF